MMELPVYSIEKKKVGSVAWPKDQLSEKARESMIHQVVVQQRTNRRQGNAHVKNRHNVAGSTRKIYKQKGTGQARHGDIRAPLFVGGGQAFGPRKKDWRSEVPRKIRREAIKDLVALKHSENKFWVLDSFGLKKPKTKEIAAVFSKFGINSGLVVLAEKDDAVEKSVRNLEFFKVIRLESLNAIDLLRYEHFVTNQKGYEKLLERLT